MFGCFGDGTPDRKLAGKTDLPARREVIDLKPSLPRWPEHCSHSGAPPLRAQSLARTIESGVVVQERTFLERVGFMTNGCELQIDSRRVILAGLLIVGMACSASGGEGTELLTTQAPSGALDGWEFFSDGEGTQVADVWQLRDGVLRCAGQPKGYLYTSKDYRNFVLTLQWRWPPGTQPGNGGVLVRMVGQHKIWPRSFEAQLNTGQSGDIWGLDGFALTGPPERSQTVEHPQFGQLRNVKRLADRERPAGEWNTYEITAERGTISLRINGEQVNQAHDCDAAAGRICLTAEGDVIEFRNVRLVER